MKAQFYLGMGLGAAAAAAAAMLMMPRKTGMRKAMDRASQAAEQAMNKIGG